MTRELLQSDIELAIRLKNERRPDEDIFRTLVRRGIYPAKVTQLLDDLRNGRRVTPQSLAEARLTLPPAGSESPMPDQDSSAGKKPSVQEPHGADRFFRVLPAAGVLAIVVVGSFYLLHNDTPRPVNDQAAWPTLGAVPAEPSSPAPAVTPVEAPAAKSLALELLPDGLRIGGNLVRRDNPLPTLLAVLGTPSRTNQIAASGATVYAYDRHGVLVYVHPDSRTNSIMLDCDATGGANGTTTAFAGTLKVGDRVLGPDTDSQTLANLKQLSVTNVRSDGSILGGRYKGCELVFAYLKSPQRLSLIEIDLQ